MVIQLAKNFPEDSLPCLQWPATGPYPKPDATSPDLPTKFP